MVLLVLLALAAGSALADDAAAAEPPPEPTPAPAPAPPPQPSPSSSPSRSPSPSPAPAPNLNCSAFMPGCRSCRLADRAARRSLLGGLDALANVTSQAQQQFAAAAYEQPSNFLCLACEEAGGYKLNAGLGRCGEGRGTVQIDGQGEGADEPCGQGAASVDGAPRAPPARRAAVPNKRARCLAAPPANRPAGGGRLVVPGPRPPRSSPAQSHTLPCPLGWRGARPTSHAWPDGSPLPPAPCPLDKTKSASRASARAPLTQSAPAAALARYPEAASWRSARSAATTPGTTTTQARAVRGAQEG